MGAPWNPGECVGKVPGYYYRGDKIERSRAFLLGGEETPQFRTALCFAEVAGRTVYAALSTLKLGRDKMWWRREPKTKCTAKNIYQLQNSIGFLLGSGYPLFAGLFVGRICIPTLGFKTRSRGGSKPSEEHLKRKRIQGSFLWPFHFLFTELASL